MIKHLIIVLTALPLLLAAQKGTVVSSNRLTDKEVVVRNCSNINTPKLEFSPMFYQTGIVYVSYKNNGELDPKTGTPFFELFYADTDRNGMPIHPEGFSIEVNSTEHEGPVSFSRSGDLMYFTRNNQKRGVSKADAQGKIRMKIYEARRGPEDWEKVVELPFNNDAYTCFHPALSPDGKRLYFSSDMPGGFGGFDLYVVEKNGDSWGKPVNLGEKVNTPKNDVFPFMHESNILFFSSNGREGLGGLDLYKVDLSSSEMPGEVINLGEPFNSAGDDLGFILNAEGTRGYFSSDRNTGFGKDDIYVFDVKDGIEGTTAPINAVVKVQDATTRKAIEGASLRVMQRTSDGLIGGNDLYDVVLMPSSEGSKELSLKLVRKKADNIGKPDATTDAEGEARYPIQTNRQYLLLVSKEGYDSEEMALNATGKKKDIVIDVELKKKTCADLTGMVRIARYGTGVPNALVKITNNCSRETITVRTNANGEFEACLKSGCDYSIAVEKEGFETGKPVKTEKVTDNFSKSLTANVDINPVGENKGPSAPLEVGTVIVLENIYYDFNKWNIRAGAARELDALSSLMRKYGSMEIDLISHTDSRGPADYNQKLSERRAEAAKRYLIARGIAAERINPIGNGENTPRNKCRDGVECTEEEHQYNRRTEVRIRQIREPVKIQYGEKGPEVIDRKPGNGNF